MEHTSLLGYAYSCTEMFSILYIMENEETMLDNGYRVSSSYYSKYRDYAQGNKNLRQIIMMINTDMY